MAINPRSEAFAALREAEEEIKKLPGVLTIGTLLQLVKTLALIVSAMRRALEWMDVIETP